MIFFFKFFFANSWNPGCPWTAFWETLIDTGGFQVRARVGQHVPHRTCVVMPPPGTRAGNARDALYGAHTRGARHRTVLMRGFQSPYTNNTRVTLLTRVPL